MADRTSTLVKTLYNHEAPLSTDDTGYTDITVNAGGMGPSVDIVTVAPDRRDGVSLTLSETRELFRALAVAYSTPSDG